MARRAQSVRQAAWFKRRYHMLLGELFTPGEASEFSTMKIGSRKMKRFRQSTYNSRSPLHRHFVEEGYSEREASQKLWDYVESQDIDYNWKRFRDKVYPEKQRMYV